MNSKKQERNKIIVTRDGSHSLYVPGLNEHYHSVHGAIAESRHIFIRNGLQAFKKPVIKILETGFGTGLNMLLTFLESQKTRQSIYYETIEKYPVPFHIIQQLNYPAMLNSGQETFEHMHRAGWNKQISLDRHFVFKKIQGDIKNFTIDTGIDIIYFDVFAPDVQPDLWEQPIFDRLYKHLNAGGILVTYSAKGIVKRRLQSAGFHVEKLPGPPGKREIIRARKTE
ncbi:MAG: tRNA (5-methylaminomethyl-2-thiouridine)(34)-methyltransferase MnmD [Bacteroidota bacterium]